MPRKKKDKPDAQEPAPAIEQPQEAPKPHLPSYRPFVGRIASGRGRLVSSDDTSYAIEANPPLTDDELAVAVKNGFDDESPDGSLLIADKKSMRDANGDINYVAYALTSKTPRER